MKLMSSKSKEYILYIAGILRKEREEFVWMLPDKQIESVPEQRRQNLPNPHKKHHALNTRRVDLSTIAYAVFKKKVGEPTLRERQII